MLARPRSGAAAPLSNAEAVSEQAMEAAFAHDKFDWYQVPGCFLAEELGGNLKPSFGKKLRLLVQKVAGRPKTS